MENIVFCKGGGCTAKLGAGVLSRVLGMLPRGPLDENLLEDYAAAVTTLAQLGPDIIMTDDDLRIIEFEEKLGFYSCTVPTYIQIVLAELIANGDFERHINRVRRKKRKQLTK